MELLRFPSRGGFSVRSILTFALTVVITAILWATLSSSPTQAVTEGETATWQNGGNSLIFDKHSYNKTTQLTDSSNTIPSGATVYQSPVQNGTQTSSDKKVFVLFFAPGVDPPSATTATYVEFTFKNGTVSNPQNKQDVPVELPGANGESGSSCSVTGVGWIVCPVSTFLADAMDKMFGILANMITVQPSVLGDPNNSMYIAWNVMRNIANIAFVIAFMIIIYSQLTSVGVSNYGLKKLIPRLIVAAVLVNISFIITAFAVDVSNILGYSIQDIFNSIREQTFHLTNDNINGFNTNVWGAVTGAVLAGGGVVGGVFYAASGGLYLLLAFLVGLLLTVLFVVIILAARQAIIVILVIIAPIAFVANLLPNTEKWFDKWKELFFTMLIFFPAFSLVFGGSQLAGQIIIQNAGDDIVTLIFGLAVQVAPLVITPLILKLSGGLLGRIAQIANNPRKGLIDRSRNWGERRAEHAKYQNIKRGARWYNPASYGAGMVRGADFKKRRLSDNTDIWKQEATNRYEQTKKYAGIHERKTVADLDKEGIHNQHAAHIEKLKLTPGTRIHNSAMVAQTSKDKLDTQQQHVAGYYNMLRTVGGTDLNESNNALEAAKGNASASEQNKEAYLNQMRTFRSTQLGAAAERLEAAKLNSEGWQNSYATHIDTLKLKPNTTLSNATVFAQSSKEHSEAAQGLVQAMFDDERRIKGTQLNASTVNLEDSKLKAEASKNLTARYISDAKSDFEGVLHVQSMKTEKAKSTAQAGEATLKRIVEEYRTGKITPPTPELTDVMHSMVRDAEQVAAESRGLQAAQNIQSRNVAEAFTEMVDVTDLDGNVIDRVHSDRANQLLDIAASVDPQGRTRAEAAATSQLGKIEREALDNNIILLEEQAEEKGINPIEWSRGIFDRQIGKVPNPNYDHTNPLSPKYLPAEPQDPALLEAAVEKLARDGNVGSIREALQTKLGGTGDEFKPIMNRVIGRNLDTLKAKGAFDVQQKMGRLWGATQEEMDVSVAGSLGAITADNVAGQKWGWWNSYVKPGPDGRIALERIIENSQDQPGDSEQLRKEKAFARDMLRSFYGNLTTALTSPVIMTKIGDRNEDTAKMHEILQSTPGLINEPVNLDYSLTRKGLANPVPGANTDTQ